MTSGISEQKKGMNTITGFSTIRTTVRELLGEDDDLVEDALSADDPLSFEAFVPGNWRPDAPPGVVVYISPRNTARMPPGWRSSMARHNLVWVGANDSGNEILVPRRVALALLGVRVAATLTPIDDQRRFLSGFSGGGRVASMMMPYYPTAFAGAIFICGANPIGGLDQVTIDAMASHRYVFFTGTDDFNLMDTQFAHAAFAHAGVPPGELTVVDGQGHALPRAADWERALAALAPPIR